MAPYEKQGQLGVSFLVKGASKEGRSLINGLLDCTLSNLEVRSGPNWYNYFLSFFFVGGDNLRQGFSV